MGPQSTPGDTSGEEQEEDNRVTVTTMDEGQHAFVSSELDRYRAGENQDWVMRHVQWGCSTGETYSPSHPWDRRPPASPCRS